MADDFQTFCCTRPPESESWEGCETCHKMTTILGCDGELTSSTGETLRVDLFCPNTCENSSKNYYYCFPQMNAFLAL